MTVKSLMEVAKIHKIKIPRNGRRKAQIINKILYEMYLDLHTLGLIPEDVKDFELIKEYYYKEGMANKICLEDNEFLITCGVERKLGLNIDDEEKDYSYIQVVDKSFDEEILGIDSNMETSRVENLYEDMNLQLLYLLQKVLVELEHSKKFKKYFTEDNFHEKTGYIDN